MFPSYVDICDHAGHIASACPLKAELCMRELASVPPPAGLSAELRPRPGRCPKLHSYDSTTKASQSKFWLYRPPAQPGVRAGTHASVYLSSSAFSCGASQVTARAAHHRGAKPLAALPPMASASSC